MKRPPAEIPRVSFVIPVYNDAVRLDRCLRSIRASWYPRESLEIIVIDNGSSDDSASVASRAGARVVTIEGVRVSELRNRAAAMATGDILAFVDADHEIAYAWITGAVDSLRSGQIAAVGAPPEPPPDGTWVQRAYGYLRGRARGTHDVDWLGAGNMAVRRRAFFAVGGFDRSLETCEDVDLCNRLKAAGFRIVSDERLKNVHHGDPATLWQVFKGELWRGRDNLRVSFRRPLVWRGLPSAVIPIADIALIFLMLVPFVASGPEGLWLSALAFAALWLPVSLKVGKAAIGQRAASLSTLAQAVAVASVYDLARALALVMPGSYQTRRTSSK